MKKYIFFLLFCFASLAFAQGAGRALYFDGDGDYVSLPAQDVGDLFANQFTIEFWVNPGNISDRPTFGFMSGHYNKFNPISSYDSGLNFGDGNSYQLMDTLRTAPANTWTHYAIVDDGTHYNVYVNGFLVQSQVIQVNPNSDDTRTFMIGDSGFDSPYDDDFNGYFEEFRIWDISFTQSDIRENMCRKITSNHPYYNHLKCCLRFDESSGTTAYDISNNNNDGALTGMDASTDAIWSGAPLGDDVVYDAIGANPEDFSVTLSHPEGDYVVLTGDGGTVTSIYLYRVDDTAMRPDATIPNGWTIDHTRFWGVFLTGSNATYNFRYYYAHHSGIQNENDLILAYREDNHDDSWEDSNATLNTWKDYLNLANQSGTEYALASENGENTLPISLAVLNVSLQNNKPLIKWVTLSETNIEGWNIYRNDKENGEEAYKINPNIIPGGGTTTQIKEYEFLDEMAMESTKTYYYWLEYMEFSGITNWVGPISFSLPDENIDNPVPVNVNEGYFLQNYPNPFNPNTTISFKLLDNDDFVKIKIYNLKGELVKEIFNGSALKNKLYNIEWKGKNRFDKNVSGGVYFYKFETNNKKVIKKMILLK